MMRKQAQNYARKFPKAKSYTNCRDALVSDNEEVGESHYSASEGTSPERDFSLVHKFRRMNLSGFTSGKQVLVRCNKIKWHKGDIVRVSDEGVRVWVPAVGHTVDVPVQVVQSHLFKLEPVKSTPSVDSSTWSPGSSQGSSRHSNSPANDEAEADQLQLVPEPQMPQYLKSPVHTVRPSHLSHRLLFQQVPVAGECCICDQPMRKKGSRSTWQCGHSSHFDCAEGLFKQGVMDCPQCLSDLSSPSSSVSSSSDGLDALGAVPLFTCVCGNECPMSAMEEEPTLGKLCCPSCQHNPWSVHEKARLRRWHSHSSGSSSPNHMPATSGEESGLSELEIDSSSGMPPLLSSYREHRMSARRGAASPQRMRSGTGGDAGAGGEGDALYFALSNLPSPAVLSSALGSLKSPHYLEALPASPLPSPLLPPLPLSPFPSVRPSSHNNDSDGHGHHDGEAAWRSGSYRQSGGSQRGQQSRAAHPAQLQRHLSDGHQQGSRWDDMVGTESEPNTRGPPSRHRRTQSVTFGDEIGISPKGNPPRVTPLQIPSRGGGHHRASSRQSPASSANDHHQQSASAEQYQPPRAQQYHHHLARSSPASSVGSAKSPSPRLACIRRAVSLQSMASAEVSGGHGAGHLGRTASLDSPISSAQGPWISVIKEGRSMRLKEEAPPHRLSTLAEHDA
eukprot:jgi/Mesen1/9120/ME000058S08613